MNREQIISMAREAGAEFAELPRGDAWLFTDDECLERFAALVASAEREACAKIVEESSLPDAYSEPVLLDIADDIRARGSHD